GEDALAHAIAQLLLQILARHAEDEYGNAGPPVRRLVRRERALDAGLAAAGDHRGGETRQARRRSLRPGQGIGRDDEPRRPQADGLGKGVVDGDVVDLHRARAPPAWRTSRPSFRSSISPSATAKFSMRIVWNRSK